ncbi:thiamine pyrophosphate-binding protein [Enemella sp. A6]|uniref:thiamine pyrophosphate-binding protein n=1 Tax=Enemella sp. A6 TaxID=3440152 RepID=UPI003EB9B220
MWGSGAQAVALALEALGVDRVFTVPSVHNLAVLKVLHERGRISVCGARHEQGAVHAADGYARATGRLGVAIVSTGPGTANAMGGLYEAHFASSPVLLLTTQIPTRYLGRGFGYIHEADRQSDMLRTVCKQVTLVERSQDLADTVVEAGLAARRGRPRPVAVEIPADLPDASVLLDAERLAETVAREPDPVGPSPDEIADALAVLREARRPLIWSGGGVIHGDAAEELQRFARAWQAPVLTSREGRGAIDEDDPLALGAVATSAAMREFIADSDVLLAVGSRFQQYPTGQWTLPWPERIVQLDVDPLMIGRSFSPEVAVIADARPGLAALADGLGDLDEAALSERTDRLNAGRAATEATRAEYAKRSGPDHRAIVESFNRHLPADTVVVRDPTVPATVWGESLLRIHHPRTSIRGVSLGIGPALPLAIGAALGSGRPTVALHGDGGFMLSIGELAAAVQLQAPVVICLFNDVGYQMLRNIESGIGDGAHHDTELATPKFAETARTFGARGVWVDSAEAFDQALGEALSATGPTLIEIDLSSLHPLDT